MLLEREEREDPEDDGGDEEMSESSSDRSVVLNLAVSASTVGRSW